MDGLNISNSNSMLRSLQTTGSSRNENDNLSTTNSPSVDGKSFAQTLTDAVGKVNELSLASDVQMQKLATGETKNIPEVLIAAEKASVGFKLLTQVRNKVIDAYQEIMKMQV